MWKCINCGEECEDNFEICWNCGYDKQGTRSEHAEDIEKQKNNVVNSEEIATRECNQCGKVEDVSLLSIINEKSYCNSCARKYFNEQIKNINLTTTNNIDGYKVERYIDIASVEIVIGTGIVSEFLSDISDFFGARSTVFETKLQKAKQIAFDKLKFIAVKNDGNAVIGIDIDYTEFTGNRIGIIVNGTIVEVKKITIWIIK